jgi:hypothetical protein
VSPERALSSVRRISRWMVWACRVLLVGLPAALAVYWIVADQDWLAVHAHLSAAQVTGPLQLWQRAAAAGTMAIPLGLLLAGLWQAQRCFAQFAEGQVFTSEATRLLQRFAGWVAAAALGAIAAPAVVSVLLTWNNPPGMRHLAVGVGSDHVFTLFFAAMVWLMAAVIGQGQVLAEENQRFV